MPNLKTFLHDGHIELSNNLAERGIKPFVMSRRNFLFSYSLKGASASAINFSLIQTAKANGLDVRKYLAYVIYQLSVIPMRDLPDLLPYSKKMVEMFRVVSISR